ncbi:hypothetical protein RHS01_09261 [Rhizoctonia solani]|uniref:Granulins domain-containing protein n=1 Tax=Rhizoctonia solani TaxID=456999 RepID=A0A8H7I3V4_9AGAM|nr:hypothetical protein RHS01_09261 [Rhizoctonia solani]
MRSSTFFSFVFFIFSAFIAVAYAIPEPIEAESIVARADDGHGHCWDKPGWYKCGNYGYCCKKDQTCCGDNKCCDHGYKCYKNDKGGEWVCKSGH